MNTKNIRIKSGLSAIALACVTTCVANAALIATWDNGSITYLDGEITAAGGTKVTISDLSATSLAGVEILVLLEDDNASYGAGITTNIAAIDDFVLNGGFLVMYDRAIGNADPSTVLPGTVAYDAVRQLDPDDLQFLPAAAGTNYYPGLDDTSFDGGNSSAHGYVTAASLGGAVPLISFQGATDQVVEFQYFYGAGAVKYSAIPADFYFKGSGTLGPNLSIAMIATLQNNPVPEPSSTLLIGLVAFTGAFRRNRR